MGNIQPPVESWKITNNSTIPVTINDIPELPPIKVRQTIEALNYTTANKLSNSPNFRNYLKKGSLSSYGYLHSHEHEDLIDIQGGVNEQYYHLSNSQHIRITDFFKDTDITAEEAEILSDGSNADNLHFHINLTIHRAFCKEDAPEGLIVRATLDSINGEEINVHCEIMGSLENESLNSAIPRIENGDPIYVYNDGEKWNCTTLFNQSTSIINLNDLDDVEISNPKEGEYLKYNLTTGKWKNTS